MNDPFVIDTDETVRALILLLAEQDGPSPPEQV
jgi:hypothetical protein